MKKLHKGQDSFNIEPKKGQPSLLCSNKELYGCPFVGSITSDEDQALDCLADILVEAFIKKKHNEFKNIEQQESGNLLPSINQGTG